jgi:hypothetical protein
LKYKCTRLYEVEFAEHDVSRIKYHFGIKCLRAAVDFATRVLDGAEDGDSLGRIILVRTSDGDEWSVLSNAEVEEGDENVIQILYGPLDYEVTEIRVVVL